MQMNSFSLFKERRRLSAGEHYVDIVGVTGSIPVTPTIRYLDSQGFAGFHNVDRVAWCLPRYANRTHIGFSSSIICRSCHLAAAVPRQYARAPARSASSCPSSALTDDSIQCSENVEGAHFARPLSVSLHFNEAPSAPYLRRYIRAPHRPQRTRPLRSLVRRLPR